MLIVVVVGMCWCAYVNQSDHGNGHQLDFYGYQNISDTFAIQSKNLPTKDEFSQSILLGLGLVIDKNYRIKFVNFNKIL